MSVSRSVTPSTGDDECEDHALRLHASFSPSGIATRSDSVTCANRISSTDMRRKLRLAGFLSLLAGIACAHLPAAGSGIPLRVMTYNIRSGNGDLAGTAQAIRSATPDIVALQEVDVHWAERSSFVDQATALGQQLRMQARFARIYLLAGARLQDPPRAFGVALLSK